METLRLDSHIATEIQRSFEDCLSDKRIHICSFYEAKPLPPLTHLVSDFFWYSFLELDHADLIQSDCGP
jgi:hypothetical protein